MGSGQGTPVGQGGALEPIHPAVAARLADVPPGINGNLALGVAHWLTGASLRKSARDSGAPLSTLHRQVQLHRAELEPKRAELCTVAASIALPIAEEAGRQLLERLTDEERADELSTPQLGVIWGIAQDKLTSAAAKANAPGAESPLADLLERLGRLGGGSVTLAVETPHSGGPGAVTINTTATVVDGSER